MTSGSGRAYGRSMMWVGDLIASGVPTDTEHGRVGSPGLRR